MGEISINHACCQLLDSNVSQMVFSQSNTCSLCSLNTSDDYLCAIWHCPPLHHFWKEITNKQSNILDCCTKLSTSLCLAGSRTLFPPQTESREHLKTHKEVHEIRHKLLWHNFPQWLNKVETLTVKNVPDLPLILPSSFACCQSNAC